MKKFGIILFFCLATVGVSAQWNTTNMLRVGKSAIMFDDYVSAIENFNNIIRIKPYLSEPYFFRGLAKLNLDDKGLYTGDRVEPELFPCLHVPGNSLS